MTAMIGFCRNLAKAELHLHLEGSVEPEDLHDLKPELCLEEIQEHYRYNDFAGFLNSFAWVARHLRDPEDYALVARRLFSRLEAQNVLYAEVILSAGVVLWKGQDFASIFEAVADEATRSTVDVRWILDAVRQFEPAEAMRVAEMAVAGKDAGVIGFGLGGDEARGPVGRFAEVLGFAKKSGLRLSIHGGESMGPKSIWGAVRLGADRIGHGINAVRDPALVHHLAVADIPLEICISSNICTGVVARLQDHPVRRLYDQGVPIVLNTDDPAMFHTTLSREYELAAEHFGFSENELRGLAANSFRYSFGYQGPEQGAAV